MPPHPRERDDFAVDVEFHLVAERLFILPNQPPLLPT